MSVLEKFYVLLILQQLFIIKPLLDFDYWLEVNKLLLIQLLHNSVHPTNLFTVEKMLLQC